MTAALGSAQPAAATQPGARNLPRLVDLGAGKCKECKAMMPILAQLRQEYAGRVRVEYIDVLKEAERALEYRWRLIPTQVFFDADGKEVWRHEGFLPKETIVERLRQIGVQPAP